MTPKGSKYLETGTHSVKYSSEALYLNPISSLAYWIRNIFQTTSQFPIFPLCTNHPVHFQVSHNDLLLTPMIMLFSWVVISMAWSSRHLTGSNSVFQII